MPNFVGGRELGNGLRPRRLDNRGRKSSMFFILLLMEDRREDARRKLPGDVRVDLLEPGDGPARASSAPLGVCQGVERISEQTSHSQK